MLFFYIRHGDPIYDPDSLTPLGRRQAEAAAKRLALYGIDKVFSSTSTRAIETAQPTCELLKKEPVLLDFCNECYTWREFTKEIDGETKWFFENPEIRLMFASEEVLELGNRWYEYSGLEGNDCKKGVERVEAETNAFFLSLGYEHIKGTGRYKVVKSNDERVALFAHQTFGTVFLSSILDIPYSIFSNHFDMCHSGITVIEFKEELGFAIPKILTLSSDSHLYREGLPTKYNNREVF